MPRVFAPHPRLAPWIHHLLLLALPGACRSEIPAALSPSLLVFPRGRTAAVAPDGQLLRLPRACLCGPSLMPRASLAEPSTVFISVMFRPGFLPEALGPGVHELRERLLPLEDFAPPARVAEMLEQFDASADPRNWIAALQALLLALLRPGCAPARALELLGARQALFAPTPRIAAVLGIGPRQLERRVAHAFGANLRELRRVTRFGFALARLHQDPPGKGGLARLAQDFGYFDQPHLDRDFRAFTGLSPGALLRAARGEDPAYWAYRFSRRNFGALFLPADVASVQESLFRPT